MTRKAQHVERMRQRFAWPLALIGVCWIAINGWATSDLILPYERTILGADRQLHVQHLDPSTDGVVLWIGFTDVLPLADLALAVALARAVELFARRSRSPKPESR